MKKPTLFLRIAATLLLLLGFARGFGGVVLLVQGRRAQLESMASDAALRAMGFGLVLVAILAIVAATLLFRFKSSGLHFSIAALLAFLIGGLVNGAVLFGRPTAAGTLGNFGVAGLILAFLLPARSALRPSAGLTSPAGAKRYP